MARKSSNDLLRVALYLGGGYLGYKLALGGTFGKEVQQSVMKLRSVLAGGLQGALPAGPGAGPGAGAGNSPPSPTGGSQPGFDANNFVAAYQNGFVAYVNGQQINGIYQTQNEAERAYNTARGFPNAPTTVPDSPPSLYFY